MNTVPVSMRTAVRKADNAIVTWYYTRDGATIKHHQIVTYPAAPNTPTEYRTDIRWNPAVFHAYVVTQFASNAELMAFDASMDANADGAA